MENVVIYSKRATDIERKLAYVRIFTVIFGLFIAIHCYSDFQRRSLLLILFVGMLYSIAVVLALKTQKSYISLISKILVVVDAGVVSLGIVFVGIDSYITQMYFILVAGVALRFTLTYTMVIAFVDILCLAASSYIYNIYFGEGTSAVSLILNHFHWFVYIMIIALLFGLISQELHKERYDKYDKQLRLDSSELLIEKFNLFTRKVNQASQMLFNKNAKLEEFMESVALEIVNITNSKCVIFTVFGRDDEIQYVVRQPNDCKSDEIEAMCRSDDFKNTALLIVENFPKGFIFNNHKNQALFDGLGLAAWQGKNLISATSGLKNGTKLIIFASCDDYEYTQIDLSMVQAFCLHIGFAMEQKENNELLVQKCLIENEIKVTAEVQKALFPSQTMEIGGIKIGCYYNPSMYVTGDYVDFFEINNRCYTVIADIMGGGLSRGFLTLGLRSALRLIANDESDSAKILDKLNKHICTSYSDLNCFVTMYISIFDFSSNTVNAAIAGHYIPMTWTGGQYAEPEVSCGIALGIDADAEYGSIEVNIQRNTLLLAYTDGIIEARNKDGVPFGKGGLIRSVEQYLAECSSIDIDDVEKKVKENLVKFTEGVGWHDDWSLIIHYAIR